MALVFSCLSGILGVVVVAWYGFAGVGGEESPRDGPSKGGVEEVDGVKGGNEGKESDVVVAGDGAGVGSGGAGKGGRGE